MKHRLKKYLKNRKKAINSLLQKPKQLYTTETFHKLRVELKKLHAFFELIDSYSKKFNRKKTFKPFKLIFRQAGKIREFQIEEEILKKYFGNNIAIRYIDNLKNHKQQEQKIFFFITNEVFIDGIKQLFHKIANKVTKLNKGKIKRYLEKRHHKIETSLNQRQLKTANIHKLRKYLKAYNYNQQSLNLDKRNKLYPANDQLTPLLGKWHDLQAIIKHLKIAITIAETNLKEQHLLKEMEAKITAESTLLWNKIQVALPKYVF